MSKNIEKRQRTKQKLTDALVELCEEKNYYDITVEDICKSAQLYRSTFYRYFDTKDVMLREIEHEYVEKTRSLTKSFENFSADASDNEMLLFRRELTADMEYHRANAKLCRFLLSPGGDLYFRQKMLESIENSVRKNMQKYGGSTSDADFRYLINFFASGFVSTIYEWLQKDDKSPEQIADFLLAIMMKLIRN